jgi:pyridoxamine 5'-phosphate oxidase
MPDWLDALRSDLERTPGPRVATLATVDGTSAEARSVVVRHIGDDGSLTFTSDARSDKNRQLRANPSATLLFWLPMTKRQYRLAGHVAIAPPDDPRRAAQWARMNDGARSLFLWPPPGDPRDADAGFPSAVPAETPVPASFELLVFTPVRVELLDLTGSPHLRKRWLPSADGWSGQTINP